MDVEQRVINVVAELACGPVEVHQTFDELDFASLDFIELGHYLEDEFRIEVEFKQYETVQEVVTLMQTLLLTKKETYGN